MNLQLRNAAHLPAMQIADRLNEVLTDNSNVVVTAPPGAGKSTLLPLTLWSAFSGEGKVIVLEPRRLAARQIAERMADMMGEEVGNTVGYRVRNESRVGKSTRIEVITEGILTRMLVSDPTLEGVAVVVFDEFHERSLTSDVALALTRESQHIIRPDLKLVIMSATIDTDRICSALHATLVECQGRMFPVEIRYASDECTPADMKSSTELTVRTILKAHREHEGDMLVFLPGEADIRRCQELLGDSIPATRVCPLYGMLSAEQQRLAIALSCEGERKIVLATSIAETSITIEGVRVVIDTGLCRKQAYDPRTGLSRLETVRISMDMANQRSGRAGRVAPGVCIRLWTKATEMRMDENRRPEIEYADLTSMVLDIAAWGEGEIEQLQWITPPPTSLVRQGRNLLHLLDALDNTDAITPRGRAMWRYPYHPRLAKMLLMAEDTDLRPFARRLAELLDSAPSTWPSNLDDPRAGRLLSWAYPERIAHHLPEGIGRYRMACGEMATVSPDDALSTYDWIAIASMNATGNGRVFLAAPLSVSDLDEHAIQRDILQWDNKQGCIIAQRERRIGVLTLSSHPLHDASQTDILRTLCEAMPKYGTSMLNFSDDVHNIQQRIATVSEWHPELALPDVSTDSILAIAAEWLPMYLGKATTQSELKKIDMAEVIRNLLSYDQQQSLDRIAPTHIVMPNHHRIKVEYRRGAELPVLRVRLQECFGMSATPRVDEGRRPILMELLSPGFKPVQLTQDLNSFWSETYYEVRKELRRRYPKHAWPENPMEAITENKK